MLTQRASVTLLCCLALFSALLPGASAQQKAASTTSSSGPALFGRKWILVQIGTQPITKRQPYLKFDRKTQSVFGNAGCNGFGEGYALSQSRLQFTGGWINEMACADLNVMKLEDNFMQALSKTVRFEVHGDRLLFFSKSAMTLVFQAKPILPNKISSVPRRK